MSDQQQHKKWVTEDGTQMEWFVTEDGREVTVVGDPKAGEEEMDRWYEGWLSRKYGECLARRADGSRPLGRRDEAEGVRGLPPRYDSDPDRDARLRHQRLVELAALPPDQHPVELSRALVPSVAAGQISAAG